MKRYLSLVAISVVFWVIGSVLLAHAESNTIVVEENNTIVESVGEGESSWAEVYLPKNDIKVELINGGRSDNKWLGSYTKALYWYQNDTVVVYGHNTKDIFGDLKEVSMGNLIVLTAIDGRQSGYIIYDLKEVSPENYQVVNDSEADLILITCVGWWDEKRLVVMAVATN